jgi:cation diffusion facilitator family transporter
LDVSTIRDWLGFGNADAFKSGHGGGHDHSGAGGHGHTHGVIDASITTTDRGLWAIKWSFIILASTATLQFVVVILSSSVALLADMIHNFGDATTAIPLWFAFVLARRKPSATFTYGLGRVEDLAGILIVLIILFSALVAGYQAINRLLHPQAVTHLGWLAAAGVIGFLGNEAVAIFRIRVGRQMNSAALIADGYHARTDGLTSLAVVLGAVGVWFGYPLADPIIGLLITVAIMGIVWQSARAVLTRSRAILRQSFSSTFLHCVPQMSLSKRRNCSSLRIIKRIRGIITHLSHFGLPGPLHPACLRLLTRRKVNGCARRSTRHPESWLPRSSSNGMTASTKLSI